MTDRDALVRAICEFPNDDTPRLIYADFLEENGEAERAAFVRAQIEAARVPAWEPFAVYCRHRKTEWNNEGKPFRDSLPELPPGMGVEWHSQAFHRGLGWRVKVSSLHGWNQIARQLYEVAPIGELDLNPPSILDDWKAFAKSETIRHLRVVHLDGPSPVEAIRALCDSPHATGIREIHFHRASSPGLPELIEDLLRTPLGRGLKGLHFRVGFESLDHLIDALAGAETTRLERLSLQTMGMTPALLDRLFQSRLTSELQVFEVSNNRLGMDAERVYTNWFERLAPALHTLRVSNAELDRTAIEALANCHQADKLKCLDLSYNVQIKYYHRLYDSVADIRLLSLRGCMLTSEGLMHLTNTPAWQNLVSLDLRHTQLLKQSVQHLLAAPVPPDLTTILLNVTTRQPTLAELVAHFGERLIMRK